MSNLFETFGSIRRFAGGLRASSILSLTSIGALAVLPTPAAAAQTAPADPGTGGQAAGDTVVITGTRVSRPGFISPTPVTSINQADIARVGAANVADALNQLPALKPSVTPGSVGNLSKLAGGNYLDLRGLGYSAHEIVKEGFAEAVVPLASGESWAKNIDLDLAGRITDYRTSGTVGTWKVGLNYAINDSVRIRATRSRDIRAPNINELFAAGQTLLFTITDPVTNSTYTVSQTTGGNPFLQPEKADTWTAGAVFTPKAIRGLNLSVDYYNIKVNGAIASLTSQTIVNRCAAGDSASCQLITRDSTGHISNILLAPVNFQTLRTDGVDVELAYRTHAFDGSIDWHTLVNYLHRLDLTNSDGSVTRFAGNTDQPVLDGPGGTPHWKVNSSITFQNNLFQASLTGRYVGGGVITRDDVTLDYNHVKGQFYLDLSTEVPVWKLNGNGRIALFGVIQNLLDNDPPFTGYEFQTARQLYDVIGRQYTLGIRARF